jgi:glucosylceramidase
LKAGGENVPSCFFTILKKKINFPDMKKLWGILLLTAIGCTDHKPELEWISSSPENLWQSHSDVAVKESTKREPQISIKTDRVRQKVDGFGGCFNELGWEALKSLPENKKDEIFRDLFDKEKGCRFNICRIPIGANDYAVDWYSHNETVDDFEMKNFSIERDKQRLIPYIKAALNINGGISIWASPWCPPSWMKTNNHYACSPDSVNDLTEKGKGREMKDQFRMEEKYLSAYALYFSKFIQAYDKEGIHIDAIHNQNEPNSCQNFPSCIWTPSSIAVFIGKYLGPRIESDKLKTEIWLGTIERPQIERIDTILQDPEAKKYIKGIGFQWGGKEAIPLVFKKYPDYKLMQTETECGNGSNDWDAAEHTFRLMKHYFENGANSYMYWNMVLNETGKSQWGWKQNSMISINTKTGEATYNPEFYLMKHFSYFIEPGASKLESAEENCLAFKNPGSITVIYYNAGNETEKTFVIDNYEFTVKMPQKSFNTFKIRL